MDEEFSFRDIVELAQDVVIVTLASPLDAPGPVIVYVNPAFTRLTGYSREEAVGQNPRILQGPLTSFHTTHEIREALNKAEPVHVAIEDYTKDGRTYWLDMSIMPLHNSRGEVTHFVAIERDVTRQKELEKQLADLAQRDPLTGLYNRRKFFAALDLAWVRFFDEGERFAIVSLDLDEFKAVNDTYGHDVGDLVLENVAAIVTKHCRSTDLAARLGGEEFSILMRDVNAAGAVEKAEEIRRAIEQTPIAIAGGPLHITASLGVAVIKSDDNSTAELLKRADRALYESKLKSRNRTTLNV